MLRTFPKPKFNINTSRRTGDAIIASLGEPPNFYDPYGTIIKTRTAREPFNIDTITKRRAPYFIKSIGLKQSKPYRELLDEFQELSIKPDNLAIPPKPRQWLRESGWYRYTFDSPPQKVEYPLEDVIIFDVEKLYNISQYPTLATACSTKAWYGWVSKYIADAESTDPEDMIPLNPKNDKKIVIGHNVGFDRALVSDGYDLQQDFTKTFFLDTMGVYTQACAYYKRMDITEKNVFEPFLEPYFKDNEATDLLVRDIKKGLSLKALVERFTDIRMNKETRSEFDVTDKYPIVKDFNRLMNYCADDVVATHSLFMKLYPRFSRNISSPSQLIGIRDMGNSKVVVDSKKWNNIEIDNNKLFKEATDSANQVMKEIAKSKNISLSKVPKLNSPTIKNLIDASFNPAYQPNISKVQLEEYVKHSRSTLLKSLLPLWYNGTFKATTPESEKFIKESFKWQFWDSTKERISALTKIPLKGNEDCTVLLPMVKTINGVDLTPNEPFWLSNPPPASSEYQHIGQPVDQYTVIPSGFSQVSIDLNHSYLQSVVETQDLKTISPYIIRQSLNRLQIEYLYDLLICINELFNHLEIRNYHLLTTFNRSLTFLVPKGQQEKAQLALEIAQYWVELAVEDETKKKSQRLTKKYIDELRKRTEILLKGVKMLGYDRVSMIWSDFKYTKYLKLARLQKRFNS